VLDPAGAVPGHRGTGGAGQEGAAVRGDDDVAGVVEPVAEPAGAPAALGLRLHIAGRAGTEVIRAVIRVIRDVTRVIGGGTRVTGGGTRVPGGSGRVDADMKKGPGPGDLRLNRAQTLPQSKFGGVLLSHNPSVAVPSALSGLASGFGMGPGVSLTLKPPKHYETRVVFQNRRVDA
jgi:hypothetical protein